MKEAPSNDSRWHYAILFAACCLWFGIIELLHPRFFLYDDNANQFLPWYLFNYKSLIEYGVLPLINFYQHLGHDHIGSAQSGVLYLPAYLTTALAVALDAPLWAIDFAVMLHLSVGVFFFYGWLGHLKIRGATRLLASAIYLTLPFFNLLSISWVFVSYTQAYLPLLFWMMHRMLDRTAKGQPIKSMDGIIYGIGCALFFCQGYVNYTAYAGLFLVIFIILYVWHFQSGWKKTCLPLLWPHLLALALSLPLLLPLLHAFEQSAFRSIPLPIEQRIGNSLHPLHAIGAQLFWFYPQSIMNSPSHMFHLGGAFLLPLLWLWIRKRQTQISHDLYFAPRLFAISLLLSTVWNLMLNLLPIFDRFRWPFKVFAFSSFFYVITLALILWVGKKAHQLPRWVVLTVLIAALTSNIIVVFNPHSQTPLGPVTVNSADFAFKSLGLPDGRWIACGFHPPDTRTYANHSQLMTHAFATLYEQKAFAGYDPLVTKTHLNQTLGLQHDCLLPLPITPERMEHLSSWSVRYFLVPNTDEVREMMRVHPDLSLRWSDAEVCLYLNHKAAPMIQLERNEQVSLPYVTLPNRLQINPQGLTGDIIVNVIPLEGYEVWIPGQPPKPIQHVNGRVHFTLESPTESVELVYRSYPFEKGLLTGSLLLLGLIIWGFWKQKKVLSGLET